MAKFHINKNGVPAPCKAQKGNCPFGGEESHFNSLEEAQIQSDKFSEKEHGLLPNVNNESRKEKEIADKREKFIRQTIKAVEFFSKGSNMESAERVIREKVENTPDELLNNSEYTYPNKMAKDLIERGDV